ncbi:CGNR zinc finger domain-containing protein [Micromonospora sp. KC723]|uniref:CGNR zinc finger domain-containing protein n=1 Tax=Micromonospora sp. KC723 TaxID=2530381 RepID=UPI0014042B82|nr:CGNR zinc finger domain-containing protein [Micromonospora sp. KC723]
MEIAALVTLVNDWGSRPREVGHREQPEADPEERQVAIDIADRLYAVFADDDAVGRATAVTAMLAETGVRPELTVAADALTASWYVPREPDVLLASAALALRDHLAAKPERLGVCHDRHCADVYVDASPAGHRRFCSLTCQNRSRVASFRKRKRRAAR